MHHGVEITDPAIVAAAELSHRYITDRFLPDKAIDLIDEAAAKIKIEIDSKPEVMDKLDRRMIQLKIEREAVHSERTKASIKRLGLIEEESKLERGIRRPDEIWKAESPGPLGLGPHQGRDRQDQGPDRELKRRASSTRWPSCNTASCPSWKPSQGGGQPRPKGNRQQAAAHPGGRRGNRRGSSRVPPASR